ncbi:MAG: hypothetical protein E6H74_10760 [Betaproteobacteria bacterium]|nr:MAG: hypothetical protein E6H74_10760 [Betaproteobacteria bacterium]
MSEQTRVAHPEDGLLSEDIEGFHFLAELALDMRSSWNHAADQLRNRGQTTVSRRRLTMRSSVCFGQSLAAILRSWAATAPRESLNGTWPPRSPWEAPADAGFCANAKQSALR